MASIDFRRAKENITIDDVMTLLGITPSLSNWTRYRGRCPFGCSSDPRCTTYNHQTGLWYCHRCKEGGDQLDLFSRVKRVDLYTAVKDLCRTLFIPIPYRPRNRTLRHRVDIDGPESACDE